MKCFLLNSKNIQRDSYIWNMSGSLMAAFQSVILLVILTRTVDLITAGIFTIANANANLFLNIGKFGIRNYQVSDIRREYSFRTYHRLRIYTVVLMASSAVLYTLIASSHYGYTLEKSLIIFWMCIFKLPDAYEDVYYGEYQRNGRLDIAAKCMTIRMFMTILFFAVILIITRNLLTTMISATLFTILLLYCLLQMTREVIKKDEDDDICQLLNLVKHCFPVFVSAFLAYYIGNAPKYAIDAQLSDDLQAVYGFISMPVFVVGLLNSFIFNPIMFSLARLWGEKKLHTFSKSVVKQSLVVCGITIICIIGAYVVGIPVLSFLYNTDLKNYKIELLWLLVGGGLLGLTGVYSAILTIMRRQKWLMLGYAGVALVALCVSSLVVSYYGIMGAVMLYNALLLALCVAFVMMITINIWDEKSFNSIKG